MPVYAQELILPKPGVMVPLSAAYNPPMLKGLKVLPDNPFKFDFILDPGERHPDLADKNVIPAPAEGSRVNEAGIQEEDQLKIESTRLIKYFLASLTVPENDLWVNLSPYEKNRIIPEAFGKTEMGRDLLAQDYLLKQITASLIYPEGEVGKAFWKKIYEQAALKYGTTNIPLNTFNKVWIVPQKAVVFEGKDTVYVVEAKLKVLLEQDYLALQENAVTSSSRSLSGIGIPTSTEQIQDLSGKIVRDIVIPQLEKEVNEGKNFAQLRQVYNSLILAVWYRQKIKDSLLSKIYTNKAKVAGVGYKNSLPLEEGGSDIEVIYQQYLQAFKKGVFNYIKEEEIFIPELPSKEQGILPRKYFSGGESLTVTRVAAVLQTTKEEPGTGQPSDQKVTVNFSSAASEEDAVPQKKIWELAPNLVMVHLIEVGELLSGLGEIMGKFSKRIELIGTKYSGYPGKFQEASHKISSEGEFTPESTDNAVFVGGSLTDCLAKSVADYSRHAFQSGISTLTVYLSAAHIWVSARNNSSFEDFLKEIDAQGFSNKINSPSGEYTRDNFLNKIFGETLTRPEGKAAFVDPEFLASTTVKVRVNGEEKIVYQAGSKHTLIIDIVRKNDDRSATSKVALNPPAGLTKEQMQDIAYQFLVAKHRAPENKELLNPEWLGKGAHTMVFAVEDKAYRYIYNPPEHVGQEEVIYDYLGRKGVDLSPHLLAVGQVEVEGEVHRVLEVERVYGKSLELLGRPLNEEEITWMISLIDKLIENGVTFDDFKPENFVVGYIKRNGVGLDSRVYPVDLGAGKINKSASIPQLAKNYLDKIESSRSWSWAKWSQVDPNGRIEAHLRARAIFTNAPAAIAPSSPAEKPVLRPRRESVTVASDVDHVEARNNLLGSKAQKSLDDKIKLIEQEAYRNALIKMQQAHRVTWSLDEIHQKDSCVYTSEEFKRALEEQGMIVRQIQYRDDSKKDKGGYYHDFLLVVNDGRLWLVNPTWHQFINSDTRLENKNKKVLVFEIKIPREVDFSDLGSKLIRLGIDKAYHYIFEVGIRRNLNIVKTLSLYVQESGADKGADIGAAQIGQKKEEGDPKKGGIDLTSGKMSLEVQGGDAGINYNLDPAIIAQWQNASGLVPVIIKMEPLGDLRQFLGVKLPLETPSI